MMFFPLMKFAALTSLVFAASLEQAAESPALTYERPVSVTGTLQQEFDRSFVENGAPPPLNKPVLHWILRLDRPISVSGNPKDSLQPGEQKVAEIDVGAPDELQKLQPKKGLRVTVSGTLFHAHTAHHLRPVMMTGVTAAKLAK